MKTRPASIPAEVPDGIDMDALDAAMQAHPVVVQAIDRVAKRARAAVVERDAALGERDAEVKAHKVTKTKLETTQGVLDTYTLALGKTPPAAASRAGQQRAVTDAEVEAMVAKMTPQEKALVLTKDAATRLIKVQDGDAMPSGNIFGR